MIAAKGARIRGGGVDGWEGGREGRDIGLRKGCGGGERKRESGGGE